MPQCRKSRDVSRVARALAFLAAGLLAGCDPPIQGSGVLLEQPRDEADFDGLRVDQGIAGYVTVGGAKAVTVVADSNVVGSIDTFVKSVKVGSMTFQVLHVEIDHGVDPVIRPSVVVTVPSFLYAEGSGGASIQLKRTPESAPVGPLLTVVLASATLDAITVEPQYATSGAVVTLTGGASAKLHSDGLVTGSVSSGSTLDNLQGAGTCSVDEAPGAHVACRTAPPP